MVVDAGGQERLARLFSREAVVPGIVDAQVKTLFVEDDNRFAHGRGPSKSFCSSGSLLLVASILVVS